MGEMIRHSQLILTGTIVGLRRDTIPIIDELTAIGHHCVHRYTAPITLDFTARFLRGLSARPSSSGDRFPCRALDTYQEFAVTKYHYRCCRDLGRRSTLKQRSGWQSTNLIQRAYRLFTMIFRNVGRRVTRVEVEALPGDAARLTFRMARPWKFRPGQHVYVYIPAIGWWTSHPFSLAWSQDEEWNQDDNTTLDPEKGMSSDSSVLEERRTSMSLIVRRRGGFTRRLHKKAESGFERKSTHWAILEGPYGMFSAYC